MASLSLRILIVAHGHPEQSPGGAEVAAYLLFRGVRQAAGIEAHFLAWVPAAGPQRPSGQITGFAGRPDETVIATSEFNSFLLSQPSAGVLAEFSRLLTRIDPDVVHFHHYTNLGIEFITAARRYKPKIYLVVTLHEYLAICHHIALANGIDPVRSPRRRRRAAGEGPAAFGFFGQIHPFKGLLELLATFDHLDRLCPERSTAIRLTIHGAYLERNRPDYIAAFHRSAISKSPNRYNDAAEIYSAR